MNILKWIRELEVSRLNTHLQLENSYFTENFWSLNCELKWFLMLYIYIFYPDEDEVVVATKKFVIMNTNGETVFSTSPKQTSMTAKKMKLSGN